jgi:hypothetical protein
MLDNETTTRKQLNAKQFFTAVSSTGGIMDLQAYCTHDEG